MNNENESHILFTELAAKYGNIGLITLNRPQALNALSADMVLALGAKLQAWAADTNILAVIIQSNNDKAFCAGGDLKLVYYDGRKQIDNLTPFFKYEYKVNLYIHDYPKPYIALLNGITMGGGAGISLLGARVIACETLKFAMPETTIGFFPDVGAAHFFARCPQQLGIFLGLTGSIINVATAIYANLVHAHVPSQDLQNFVADLTTQDLRQDPLHVIDTVIAKYQRAPGDNALLPYMSTIESCFKHDTVEAILVALQADGSPWAQQQIAILNTKSPTSLKITLKYLRRGINLSIADIMDMQCGLATQLFQQHDVYEGIRTVLIDKTHDPKWQPKQLADVSDQFIDRMFEFKCKL